MAKAKARQETLQLKDQLAAKAIDKYYSLFNSINQGFCIIEMIWDEKGHPIDYLFLETNPAFEKHTRIKDAVGRKMREIEPKHESHWFEIYGEVVLTGKPIHFEQKAEALIGGWYDVHAFPIEKGSNRVAVLFEDVTERKKTEHDLHESEKKYLTQLQLDVEKRTEEIGKLNSELRYLNTITANNYTETLRHVYINLETIVTTDARNLSNSSRANLRRAQAAIQRMKLLTNDINNYLQLYDIEIKKETIYPNNILQNVIESLQRKIEESNAKINIDKLPSLDADPVLFSKLMTHLIDNSIKFRKENIDPIINISYCMIDQIVDHKSIQKKPFIVINVSDNGIGFEKAETIFELFTQLHEPGKHKGGGMGLAICRKIMEMHGGFITADSTPGHGATFNCYFPSN